MTEGQIGLPNGARLEEPAQAAGAGQGLGQEQHPRSVLVEAVDDGLCWVLFVVWRCVLSVSIGAPIHVHNIYIYLPAHTDASSINLNPTLTCVGLARIGTSPRPFIQ